MNVLKQFLSWAGKLSNAAKFALCCSVLVLIAIPVYRTWTFLNPTPPSIQSRIQSSLKNIENRSDLRVLNTPYSAIATVWKDEAKTTPEYHVWYTASLEMNTDFSRVQVSPDEEKKEILIKFPPVTISYEIEPELKYLPEPPKGDAAYQQAYKAAQDDLAKRIRKDVSLQDLANQNAAYILEDFTSSIAGSEYTVRAEVQHAKTATSY